MPFPTVNFCLVCEGVRPELGGKFSILGFFGLTPNVDIAVGRLDQPLGLSVVLGFGLVTDVNQVYNHSISVTNPDGSVLFQSPIGPINVVRGKAGLLVSGAAAIPRVAGPRTVRLVVNGQTLFEGQFLIRQATPQELAGLPGAAIH